MASISSIGRRSGLRSVLSLFLLSLSACSSKDASTSTSTATTGAGGASATASTGVGGASTTTVTASSGATTTATASSSSGGPMTRDPLKQPFASTSIWNMPLGSGAVYATVHLSAVPGNGTAWAVPYPDPDQIILRPSAPAIAIDYSSVGWSGGNRCTATNSMILANGPVPVNFLVPNGPGNNSGAILAADGHTLVQTQPFTRCTNGGIATSLVRAPDADLYGDGIRGAHGASGMSSIGGTLRLGELRPGQQGPRHALKLDYYMKEAGKCATWANCFRWPAVSADTGANNFYGTGANNPNAGNTALRMGALLALPPSVDIATLGLETEPATELAWTLQNYGGYIVDDTAAPAFAICTENGPDGTFTDQFKSDYGYDFQESPTANVGFTRDIQKLLPKLAVVDNNTATSIGGGGTPRQPLAPAVP